MRLVRIWDYFMRRKPLLVALFVMLASGLCSYNLTAQRRGVSSENLAEISVAQAIDNGLALHILDENQAPIYQMILSDDFRQATITIGAGSLASETYVRILDAAGNLIVGEYTTIYDPVQNGTEETMVAGDMEPNVTDDADAPETSEVPEVSGVKYYFSETPKNYSVALTPGMKIELQAKNVKFYSTLDGAEVAEFAPRTATESYVVSANGLKRADWDEVKAQDIMYGQLKRYADQQIRQYQENISEHVLYNKTLDVEKKAEIARLYAKLLPTDQENYSEFIEQLQKGGVPTMIYRGALEYKQGEIVDLLELLDVHDNEDGEIARGEIVVEGAVDFAKPGSYELVYSVTDSDNNTTQLRLTIVVTEEQVDVPSQVPSEERPATVPSEVNGGETEAIEPIEELAVMDMGIGTGVSEVATDETGVVWSAQEFKVDYEPVEEEVTDVANAAEIVADNATQEAAESMPTQVPEQKAEQVAETASKKMKAGSKTVGANVFFIAAGLLVCCGLIKFIFDHYIR